MFAVKSLSLRLQSSYYAALHNSYRSVVSSSLGAYVNNTNVGPVNPLVMSVVDTATANQKQITGAKIQNAINKFKKHQIDTGSSSVQIAVMTEKIINLARHFATHKKDHHSKRGFQKLISRRRQLMKHLRRYDFETFARTVKELKLDAEAKQLPLKI
jgi:small subunit ribosomal protein S15